MKFFQHILKFITSLTKNNFLWAILKPLAYAGETLLKSREEYVLKSRVQEIGKILFEKSEVQSGPFRGMKYLDPAEVDYTVLPKILGSYEKELWPVFEKNKTKDYRQIVNIGCGEGYYTVGLALLHPEANIQAYDIRPKARKLCHRLACLNGVSGRIDIHSGLSAKQLESYEFKEKTLILCDCEGYEKELFTVENASKLAKCDLLIETHDFIDLEISSYLKKIFQNTHQIYSIFSVDDIQKVLVYKFEALEGLSLNDKKIVLTEQRPAQMEWIFCTPVSSLIQQSYDTSFGSS